MNPLHRERMIVSIALRVLIGLMAASALFSLGSCAPGASDGNGGSDASEDLPAHLQNPEASAQIIFRNMERQFPEGEADIVDGLPAEEGPEDALFGVLMDDTNQLYVTGIVDDDNEPIITGAVLEDVRGQLIIKQEIDPTVPDTTITVATGDSMRFSPAPGSDALYVELVLLGTETPTTLVYIVEDDGETLLIADASYVGESPSEGYTGQEITLPRASKLIPMMRTQDFNPTVLRDAVASRDCPIIDLINNGIDDACSVWSAVNAVSSKNPGFAQMCASSNVFLDTLRDGDPSDLFDIPGVSTTPVAPETVAKLKIGLNTLCFFGDLAMSADEGWLKFRTKAVDFACFAQTIINERSRLVRGGGTVADRICRGLSGDILVPGCINTCEFSGDGQCDDGGPDSDTSFCPVGTDCADCGPRGEEDYENIPGCTNECALNFDGRCDDGGPGSFSDICAFGTDCADCGKRDVDETPFCGEDDICNEGCAIEDQDPDCDGEDFCRIYDICCDGDGICDLVRCPSRTDDSDCTNTEWCDRLDLCCPDDGECDTDCPSTDEDCGPSCEADGQCADNCSTPDPDCVVNAPTSEVCPSPIVIDIGVFDPTFIDLTLARFEGPESEDDYSATCVYQRAEGGTGEWAIVLTYIPPFVSDFPSGACDSEEPGDRVFNSGVLESTVRHVEVVEVFSGGSRLVDREDVLGELLDNLISAEVGVPCE